MGGGRGSRMVVAALAALTLVAAPMAAAAPDEAGTAGETASGVTETDGDSPGQPKWPDGPPPGSVYEPHLQIPGPWEDPPGGEGADADQGSDGIPASVRNQVPTARLSGTNRYATAVQVSRHVFPRGADTVYLAQGQLLVDAQSAGSLTDGPVLLIPSCGSVPSAVSAEIDRVDPSTVVALGGTGSICEDTLQAAAAGRATDRVSGATRYETAALIAQRAFPEGAATVYVANGQGAWSPDALVGGTLTDGPVVLVERGRAPGSSREAIEALAPSTVVALGGAGVVSDATLTRAAAGRPTSRLAGADRYATAAAVAQKAFGGRANVAYVARGDEPADAVVGGTLTAGPVLLSPPTCRVLPSATWRHLSTARPDRVIALGGTGAVCSEQLATAARMSTFTALESVRDRHLLDLITKRRAIDPLKLVPADLVNFRGGSHRLRSEVSSQLDALFRDAAAAGHPQLHLTSAFRSYETQQATYDYWVRVLGQKEADRVSARPGHSEHQLGQAADIWGRSCDGRDCFGSTPEGRWVAANAYRYGFIIRYPRGGEPVTGYVWEPWHLRYVGPRAAWMMKIRGEIYWEYYRAQAVGDSRGF
ncbi:cell wall-binding repeat-containing protein [Ornithinimicrobium sp. Y1847]|uniref:cell wall-binding repeat-containing protein n=1 Tax=Ornithinimicrobium sp. Y1847 TaxID=3405419 RepID=UPI003B677591